MAIPVNIKPKLSEFVNIGLAKSQALLITKVQKIIREKLEELLNSCPPPEVLKAISLVIENVRPIITNTEREISRAGKVADQLNPAITAGNLLIEIFTKNPLPAIAINGVFSPVNAITPAGAVVTSLSRGFTNRETATLQWARNLVEVLSDEGLAITDGISAAQSTLSPVKNQLDQLDALVQACFVNQDLSDEDRKLLLQDIQGRDNQDPALAGLQYTSPSGRVYTIKIVEDKNSPQIAPRRQAIVQDFRGITVLTGPASFATRTQILIDEIKFRIDNQLP
jgi:hypothetical protein